jgi:hypothetical protein
MATWKKLAYEDDCVLKTSYNAYTVLAADTDDIPAPVTMNASTMLARLAAGGIVAANVSQIQTLLSIPNSTHNMFSATHADTTGAAAPVDGDLIIGNATPLWSKLAITVPAGAGLLNVLGVVNAETRGSWKALFDATASVAITAGSTGAAGTSTVAAHRDHNHAAPATWAPDPHALSDGTVHTIATANLNFGGYQAANMVFHQTANATTLAALTAVVGKAAMQIDTLSVYVCTAI